MEILIRLTVASLSGLGWTRRHTWSEFWCKLLRDIWQECCWALHSHTAWVHIIYHITFLQLTAVTTRQYPRAVSLCTMHPRHPRIMTEGGWRENRMCLCCVTVFTFQWLLLIFSEHIWTERSVAPISAKVELNRGVSAVGASTKINKLAKLGGRHVDVDLEATGTKGARSASGWS